MWNKRNFYIYRYNYTALILNSVNFLYVCIMKKTPLLFLNLLISICSYSNEMDTVEVNPDFAATLEFSSNIDYLLIGNNPVIKLAPDGSPVYKYFEIFTKNNVAVLRCQGSSAPTTSLTIGLVNSELWTGYLGYSEKPKKNFYSYKPEKIRTQKEIEDSLSAVKKNTAIDMNLERILAENQAIEDIAVIKRSEVYQVTNIANDDRFTYIKIKIANNSASNYIVDGVMFKYREGKKRKGNNKEVYNENWMSVEGFKFPSGNEIKARSADEIVFCIPLYTTENGFLIIKILEKNGSRTSDIEISAKDLSTITYYK